MLHRFVMNGSGHLCHRLEKIFLKKYRKSCNAVGVMSRMIGRMPKLLSQNLKQPEEICSCRFAALKYSLHELTSCFFDYMNSLLICSVDDISLVCCWRWQQEHVASTARAFGVASRRYCNVFAGYSARISC